MNQEGQVQEGQCECGHTKFTIHGKPITRMYCHCTVCQEFNQSAYSDVTLYLTKDVDIADKSAVDFKKYKSPPAVDRGKCVQCQKPAIELMALPLMPKLTIIPSENIPQGQYLPESSAHVFYHRRVDDISDSLPKYSGFLKSQIALTKLLMIGFFQKAFGK